jgi:TRAP-type C4-dicarboxylate transport system substrate-binding protein
MVDGAENNPPSFYTSHHYDVCKYYSLDEHLRVPDVLIMSTKVWQRLSPEFQRILQEAANASVVMQKKLWAEMTAHSLEEVQKAGVTINRPDKESFRRAVRPIWEKFEGTEVGRLAERIQEVR